MTIGNSGIWAIVAVAMTAATTTISVVMYFLRRESMMRRYDEEHHRAQLEAIRESLEEQIYKLNDRLMATDERWRDVNHLLLSAQRFPPSPDKLGRPPQLDFLRRAGIESSSVELDNKLVFVLTPFHVDYQSTYDAIASVCSSTGLKCMRGDEEHITGDILRHILRLLAQCRLVVANVDGRNPNVFYELGIAYALGKPVLIVASSTEGLPFDIQSTRIIFWHSVKELQQKLRGELLKIFVAEGS